LAATPRPQTSTRSRTTGLVDDLSPTGTPGGRSAVGWDGAARRPVPDSRAVTLARGGARHAADYLPGDADEEAAPPARLGPQPERVRPDRRLRRRCRRSAELRRGDRGRRGAADPRRDLHARAGRPPAHRRVGRWL